MSNLTCESCRGRSFYEDEDGFMVCRRCETVSRNYRTEMGEVNDVGIGTRKVRRGRSLGGRLSVVASPATTVDVERDSPSGGALVSAKIAELQVKAIIRLGSVPMLKEQMQLLFRTYMAPRYETAIALYEEENMGKTISEDKKSRILELVLLNPRKTLALCCIALRQLRSTMMAVDLVKFVLVGRLPYFTAFPDTGKSVVDTISPKYHGRLYPQEAPHPRSITSIMHDMMLKLGLECPRPEVSGLILKLSRELSIGKTVTEHAVKLALGMAASNGAGNNDIWSPNWDHNYLIRAFVYLIISIKLHFGLDADQDVNNATFSQWANGVDQSTCGNAGRAPIEMYALQERTSKLLQSGKEILSGVNIRKPQEDLAQKNSCKFKIDSYVEWCRDLFGRHRKDRVAHGQALQGFADNFRSRAEEFRVTLGNSNDNMNLNITPIILEVHPDEANIAPYITLKSAAELDRTGQPSSGLPRSLRFVVERFSRHIFAREQDLYDTLNAIESRLRTSDDMNHKSPKRIRTEGPSSVLKNIICCTCRQRILDVQLLDPVSLAAHRTGTCHPQLPIGWHSHKARNGKFYFFHENDPENTTTWKCPVSET